MTILPALILLAASQAEAPTQNEQLETLRWELQELRTDEEWKPERVGVDEIPAETA